MLKKSRDFQINPRYPCKFTSTFYRFIYIYKHVKRSSFGAELIHGDISDIFERFFPQFFFLFPSRIKSFPQTTPRVCSLGPTQTDEKKNITTRLSSPGNSSGTVPQLFFFLQIPAVPSNFERSYLYILRYTDEN